MRTAIQQLRAVSATQGAIQGSSPPNVETAHLDHMMRIVIRLHHAKNVMLVATQLPEGPLVAVNFVLQGCHPLWWVHKLICASLARQTANLQNQDQQVAPNAAKGQLI